MHKTVMNLAVLAAMGAATLLGAPLAQAQVTDRMVENDAATAFRLLQVVAGYVSN